MSKIQKKIFILGLLVCFLLVGLGWYSARQNEAAERSKKLFQAQSAELSGNTSKKMEDFHQAVPEKSPTPTN